MCTGDVAAWGVRLKSCTSTPRVQAWKRPRRACCLAWTRTRRAPPTAHGAWRCAAMCEQCCRVGLSCAIYSALTSSLKNASPLHVPAFHKAVCSTLSRTHGDASAVGNSGDSFLLQRTSQGCLRNVEREILASTDGREAPEHTHKTSKTSGPMMCAAASTVVLPTSTTPCNTCSQA